MAFGIYKPEQGYWVRVLSAVSAGILVLAGAAWAYSQAGAVNLPPKGYVLELKSINGDFKVGDTVDLIRAADDAEGTETIIVTAGVLGYESTTATTARLEIDAPKVTGDLLIADTERVRTGDSNAQVHARLALPIFPIIYLQAGLSAAVMLLGSIGVYFFIASHRGSVGFLINTDGEMRKVNWSTRKEIIGSTQVVIVTAVLTAALLFGIDMGFQIFFRAIGVLQT